MVLSALPAETQERTYKSLAELMGMTNAAALTDADKAHIRGHTLIRRIENFDPEAVLWQSTLKMTGSDNQPLSFVANKRQLPARIPEDWSVTDLGDNQVRVVSNTPLDTLLPELRVSKVTSAGQLPTGFDPAALYASRNHPRGLQMAVYGASDTLRSTGFSVEQLKSMVAPDQFAVYSGSAMGQLDADGYAGLLQNPVIGKRPSSKHCALGLPEMPGDFVNAYVLGSVGETAEVSHLKNQLNALIDSVKKEQEKSSANFADARVMVAEATAGLGEVQQMQQEGDALRQEYRQKFERLESMMDDQAAVLRKLLDREEKSPSTGEQPATHQQLDRN